MLNWFKKLFSVDKKAEYKGPKSKIQPKLPPPPPSPPKRKIYTIEIVIKD